MSPSLVDPDRQSVERTLAGDTAEFGVLVDRHREVVHRVAARVVGPADAEDVSQEAFLRAFHRLEKFRGDSRFRAWLLQITYNTALNAASRGTSETADPTEAEERRESDEKGPAMELESRERRERLEGKLRLLRPEHRAVLVLRDVEGLAYEEIATATSMPLGSVKGRLHRARGELLDILRRNTYDWELPR
jgi:RNA polymerase sigma-70 factor, ECF subfamily